MKKVYTYYIIGLLMNIPLTQFAQTECSQIQSVAQPLLKKVIINSDSKPRSFFVYTPQGYNAHSQTKVVFMFHGTGQDGLKMFQKTKWNEEADRENFLLVLPNSLCYYLLDEQAVKSRWNDGTLNVRSTVTPANDVLFFRDMLKWVDSYRDSLDVEHNLHNPSKIYIAGFSNGAMFCSKLVMEVADKITAAGIVSSILPNTNVSQPSRPVPTIIFYGSKDQRVLDTLQIVSSQFPRTPASLYQNSLFQQLIDWHLLRNGLNNSYQQTSSQHHYSLTFTTPLNGIADSRKYFEVRVYKGLGHNYPANNTFPNLLNATKIFNNFFNQY
ncbi:MAG: hypothetical protein KDD21_08705 [Bacteroidetes bacterium]|nr:hypothetical protein [Bacteroidota bacterium]